MRRFNLTNWPSIKMEKVQPVIEHGIASVSSCAAAPKSKPDPRELQSFTTRIEALVVKIFTLDSLIIITSSTLPPSPSYQCSDVVRSSMLSVFLFFRWGNVMLRRTRIIIIIIIISALLAYKYYRLYIVTIPSMLLAMLIPTLISILTPTFLKR